MNLTEILINIATSLLAVAGTSTGAKSLHNNNKLKERVKTLEVEINNTNNNINQQLTELKMHFVNFETKLEMIALQLQIKNNNVNEINFNKKTCGDNNDN